MNVPALIIAGLLGWTVLAYVLAPWAGAHFAGRPMTRAEREQLGWNVLGVFMGLFVVAVLLIGTLP